MARRLPSGSEHPHHQAVGVGLGERLQFLAAEVAAHRLERIDVTLKRHLTNAAPTGPVIGRTPRLR
ncbi:hypothetical protein [Mycolicibacterium brisbanense]